MKRHGCLANFVPVVAALGFLTVPSLPLAGAESGRSWDGPPFSAAAANLLSDASREAGGSDQASIILLDETEFRFDAQGRRTWRSHEIVKILTPAGIDGWATMDYSWSPWHQDRPELRARVIAADGTIRLLDQATIAEASAGPSSGDVYSDLRQVRAALPGVEAGSIVEREVEIRDHRPFFDAGENGWGYFGASVPVVESRLRVSIPKDSPFTFRLHDLAGVKPRKLEEEKGVTWLFEAPRLAPLEPAEANRPADVSPQPLIVFSTARSWTEVARTYSRMVEQKLSGSDTAALREIVDPLVRGVSDRREIADRLYHWLSKNVRYTGIEFGVSAIDPHTPAETLARRYGDCKDKAALLVAMLRQAGIPARIALLNADAVMDVEEDLPGINGFDHAIVYVPGDPAFWIDPTDEFGRAGSLPASDEDRRALVVGTDTAGLTRTPSPAQAANTENIRFEVRLADSGKASVSSTEIATGEIERRLRAVFRDTPPDKLRETISRNVRDQLAADELVSLNSSPADDFSAPFRFDLRIEGSGRGSTEDFTAAASLPVGGICGNLPEELQESEPEHEQPSKDPSARPSRRLPFVVRTPSTTVWEFHVIPPAGFVAVGLPSGATTEIGPNPMTESYEKEADGSVLARFQFDVSRRQMSVDEFHQARRDYGKFMRRNLPVINFRLAAAVKFGAGDLSGAIRDLHALAATRPRDAMIRARLAQALAEAGAGDAARREVEEAVRLDGKSAVIRRAQARVLARDRLGRQYHAGSDRKGAIAAYRKAIEIDATGDQARSELALLLEYGPRGDRFSGDSDLAGAATEYEYLADRRGLHGMDENLFLDLFRLGRYAELRKRLEGSPSENRDAYRLALTAVEKGAAAAIDSSSSLPADPAARRKAFLTAAQLLLSVRRYPEAAPLFREASRGSENGESMQALVSLLSRTKRQDGAPVVSDDPVDAARRFFAIFLTDAPDDTSRAAGAFSDLTRRYLFRKDEQASLRRAVVSLRSMASGKNLDLDAMADLVLAAVEWSTEKGTEMTDRVIGRVPGSDLRLGLFVRREGNACRIVTTTDASSLLGVAALDALRRNDTEEAGKWLDWAREEVKPQGGDDPLAGSAFPAFWTRGDARDRRAIDLAAAALIADGPAAGDAIPILEPALSVAAAERRTALTHALALAELHSESFEKLWNLSGELASRFPRSESAYSWRTIAGVRLGRRSEAIEFARNALSSDPDNPVFIRGLSDMLAQDGRLDESRRLVQRLIDSGRALPLDYNNLAWSSLAGTVTSADLEVARKAVNAKAPSAAALNTLAAVEAALDHSLEARNAALAAMAAAGRDEPEYMDWYVFGRLLEDYGERGDALSAYGRIPSDSANQEPKSVTSVYALAQQRMVELRKPVSR